MKSKNRANILGHIGGEPEQRSTPTGKRVVTFAVATSERWKDGGGEVKELTTWHRRVAWEKTADLIAEMAHKGSAIEVEGRIRNRSYKGKDGQARYISEIIVDDFWLMARRSGLEGPAPPADDHWPDDSPDVPF